MRKNSQEREIRRPSTTEAAANRGSGEYPQGESNTDSGLGENTSARDGDAKSSANDLASLVKLLAGMSEDERAALMKLASRMANAGATAANAERGDVEATAG